MKKWILTALIAGMGTLLQAETPPHLKSFMFRDAPVEYVMSILGESWDRHIVVNESAKGVEVRAFLREIDCLSALKAVCHSHGLWYREDPDSSIIYVQKLEEFVQGSSMNERKFVETVTAIYARAEDLADNLQEVFRDMVVYTRPDDESGDDFDDIDRALNRMDQLSQRSTILEGTSSSSSQTVGSSSRSTSSRRSTRRGVQEGMDNVTEYYDDMKRLNEREGMVIAEEDGQPKPQMPGVVFIGVVKRSNIIVMRSSDRETLEQVKRTIQALDKPKPQVLLEMRILALDVTDEKDRQIDFLVWNDRGSGIGFVDNLTEVYADNNMMGALGVAGSSVGSQGSVFQLLNKHYQIRLKLMDGKGKVRSLATPSLLVADFEASRIFVGEEATILTDVTNTQNITSGDNPVVTTVENPVTQRRDVGTTLVITPKIHADGTVTIRVMQESAELGATRRISYGTTGQFFDTADIKKQIITSTIVAKSGETIALGGLMQQREEEIEQKVPYLSAIPYLGWLFKRVSTEKVETELMVLIRPTVILSPDGTHVASEELLKTTIRDTKNTLEAFDVAREERRQAAETILADPDKAREEEKPDSTDWPEFGSDRR